MLLLASYIQVRLFMHKKNKKKTNKQTSTQSSHSSERSRLVCVIVISITYNQTGVYHQQVAILIDDQE
jgi:Na+-transporting methylmalonyl-CoA/oxaloacetate decarboxylase gamma subunit